MIDLNRVDKVLRSRNLGQRNTGRTLASMCKMAYDARDWLADTHRASETWVSVSWALARIDICHQ